MKTLVLGMGNELLPDDGVGDARNDVNNAGYLKHVSRMTSS